MFFEDESLDCLAMDGMKGTYVFCKTVIIFVFKASFDVVRRISPVIMVVFILDYNKLGIFLDVKHVNPDKVVF